jgi:hypothetical protein
MRNLPCLTLDCSLAPGPTINFNGLGLFCSDGFVIKRPGGPVLYHRDPTAIADIELNGKALPVTLP